MPDSPSAVSGQLAAPRAGRRRLLRRSIVRPLALVLGLALLGPAVALTPEPTVAGGSCTGWGSKTVPPNSIRVLRSNSGQVERVDFRRYVLVVMGKEWGAYLPMEALEAGAQAVKQFAWYHSLEGRHRSGYVTASGECFDVKDTTADQLYRPESSDIGAKHHTAVDAIWGLSLRKDGRFFLTQYRAGQNVPCASDADEGLKLYAKSAIDCAKKGWSSSRILNTYYGPNMSETWANTSASGSTTATDFDATVSKPRPSLRAAQLSSAPVLLSWRDKTGAAKISGYQLQRRLGDDWTNVANTSEPRFNTSLKWGVTQRFRVRATDGSGNYGPWARGPAFTPYRRDDRSSRLDWSRGWQRRSDSSAVKDTLTYSGQQGAAVSFRFTGRAVALVATRGPNRGRAHVYVDGSLVETIDLYAGSRQSRMVVFSRTWSSVDTHTLRVVVAGTDSRPRVEIDAFAYVR